MINKILLNPHIEDLPMGTEVLRSFMESRKTVWSATTLRTAEPKLRLMIGLIDWDYNSYKPQDLHNKLIQLEMGEYSIFNYLRLFSVFEQSVFYLNKTGTYLKENSYKFRNAYKEKTKKIPFEKIIEVLNNDALSSEYYNFISLCALGGLRVNEALSLRWDQCSAEEKTIIVTAGKGNKQRVVPFDMSVSLKKVNHEKPCGTLTRGQVRHRWPKELAGFSPHDLRAAYITHLVNTPGISVKDVAIAVGHSNINTTSRYIRPNQGKILKAMREALGAV